MIVRRCRIGLVDSGRHAANENNGKSSLTSSYDCYSINALHSASMTSNARESQGGAELNGISVERLHDTAIPNIAPGSCFQSWSLPSGFVETTVASGIACQSRIARWRSMI